MAIPFLSPIGNINISDGTPQLKLTDTSSSATTTLTLDGVNLTLQNNGTDGDFTIIGKDGSNYINLLAFDTSEGGAATFAGSITTNLSSEGTYFTGGSGGVRQLSITSGTNTSAHALHTFNIASTNGKYEFEINSTPQLTLDSSSAIFAGDITLSTDADILKSGTNPFRVFTNGTLGLSISASQNATFPNNVTATTFNGDLNGTINTATTATTQSASDNSTKVATTAYVDTAVTNLVDSSPDALNTLNELAAALGDDANFSTTVTNNLAAKVAKAGDTMTGNLVLNNSVNLRFKNNAGAERNILTLDTNDDVQFGGSIDDIRFLTNDSSEKMRLTSGGRLGIGVTAPSYSLEVLGDSQVVARFKASNNSTSVNNGGALIDIQNTNSTNGNMSSLIFRDSNGNASSGIFGYHADHSDGEGFLTFGTRNSSGSFAEKMRLDSSGRLGISVTSLSSMFTLQGNETGGQTITHLHLNSGNNNSFPFLASLNNATISSATYGWTFNNSSSTGNLEIGRRNNSTTTSTVLTLERSTGNATFADDITVNGGDVNVTKQNDAPIFVLTHDGTNPGTSDNLWQIMSWVDYNGTHENWGNITHRTTSDSNTRTELLFDVKSQSGNVLNALTLRGGSGTPTATFTGDVSLAATKKLYLDGGNTTYITESSDGVIDFYGDNVHLVSMKQNGTQNEVVVNEASGDVDFRVEANNDQHAFFVEAEGAGKVGISTDSPEQKLHVVGTQIRLDNTASSGGGYYLHDGSGTFRAALWDNGTNTRLFADGNGSTAAITIDSNNSTFAGTVTANPGTAGTKAIKAVGTYASNGDVKLLEFVRTGDAVAGAIEYNDATTDMEIGTITNHAFSIKTNDTRRLTFANSGAATFAGDVDFDENITLTGSGKNIVLDNSNELRSKDTSGTQRTIARVQSGNTLQYGWSGAGNVEFKGGGSYTTRMAISSSNGYIGIGESFTTPSAALHIKQNQGASNDAVLRLRGTNTTNRITRLQLEDYKGTLADGLIQFRIPTADTASSAVLEIGVNSAGLTFDHSNNATFTGDIIQGSDSGNTTTTLYGNSNNLVLRSQASGTRAPELKFNIAGTDIYSIVANNNTSGIAANTLTINQGSTPKFFFFSDGNFSNTGEITSGSQVTVDSNWVSNEGSLSIVHDQNTLGGIGIVANNVYKGGLIQRDGTEGDFMELTAYQAQPLKLRTSNTDAVTIDASQNTTFAGKIHINDDSNPDGGSGAGEGGSLIVEGRRDGTANLISLRARDASAPTVALPNGQGGLIRWQGFDGTDFAQMGAIAVVADGQAVANGDSPSKMIFYTTADGGESLTTALTLDKSQNATFEGDITVQNGSSTHNSAINIKGYEPRFHLTKTRGSSGDDIFRIAHENDASAVDFSLSQNGSGYVRTARITSNNRWVIGGYEEVNSAQLSVQGTFGTTGGATFGGAITTNANNTFKSAAGSGSAIELNLIGTNTSGFGSSHAVRSRIKTMTDNTSNAYASKLEFYTNDASNNLDLALKLDSSQNATFGGNVTISGSVDAASFTDIITNQIFTASGSLDIDTVLTGRDVTFTQGSNEIMTIKGDRSAVVIKSDGSVADGATLKLTHANNNTSDTISTIFFGNNADSTLSAIVTETSGANNSSNLKFKTSNAGTLTTAMTIDSTQVATFESSVYIKDAGKFLAGTGNDLQMYHNGNDSYISDTGTGDLRITSSAVKFYNAAISDFMATMTDGGSVDLYHNGNLQAGTMSDGWQVPATKGVYFDGGSHTYIKEISADRLGVYVGGTLLLDLYEGSPDYIHMHAATTIHATSYDAGNSNGNGADEFLAEFKGGTNNVFNQRYVKLTQTFTGSAKPSPLIVFEANHDSDNHKSYVTLGSTSDGEFYVRQGEDKTAVAAGSDLAAQTSETFRITPAGNATFEGNINGKGYLNLQNGYGAANGIYLYGNPAMYRQDVNTLYFPLNAAIFAGTVKGTTYLVNHTSAAGIGASLGDINSAELGPGYLSLSRDDTASAKQIVFEKNDVEHSFIQTTSSGLNIGGANVGIGSTTPSHKLQVYDATSDAPLMIESGDGFVGMKFKDPDANDNLYYRGDTESFYFTGNRLGVNNSSPTSALHIANPPGNSDLKIEAGTASSVTGQSTISMISRNASSGTSPTSKIVNIFEDSHDSALAFHTSDAGTTAEKMRITSAGNIVVLDDVNIKGTTFSAGFLRFNSSGKVRLSANNNLSLGYAETLNITNTELVGIGEASPAGKLHVKTADAGTITTNSAHDDVIIEGSGNTGINIFSGTSSYQYLAFGDTGGANRGYVRYHHGDDQMVLRAGGTDTVYVDAGKVGVGTDAPIAKFEVTDGSSSITLQEYNNGATIFLDGSDGDFTGGDYFHIIADGTSYLGLGGYGGGATPLNVTNAGNVGIGTNSPQEDLHVYDTGTARIEVEGTTGPAAFKATNNQGSFGWYVPSDANNFRIFNFGTNADLVTVDASGNTTFGGNISSGGHVFITDTNKLIVGSGEDFKIQHDGNDTLIENETGHVYFSQFADDRDIYFRNDNGSGGIAIYYTIDGGNEVNLFSKNVKLSDSVELRIGSGNDLKIYHDGTNNFITSGAVGFYVQGDYPRIQSAAGENYFVANPNAEVNLYYNNSKKFETTSAGVSITGDGTFTGNVNAGTGLRMYTDGSGNGVIYNLGQDKDLYLVGDDGGSGINALVFDMSDGGAATFAGAVNTGGTVTVTTATGEITIGSSNASGAHIYTDRARFFFNKTLRPLTGIFASYGNDLKLQRDENSSHQMTLSTTAATFTHDVVAFSDKKLKKNIKTLDGSKVYDMRGVSFTRKDNGEDGSGVIAQEMQKVAPELVNETDGTLGVSYGNITGYLIEAIKDLKAEVEDLKKQLKNK